MFSFTINFEKKKENLINFPYNKWVLNCKYRYIFKPYTRSNCFDRHNEKTLLRLILNIATYAPIAESLLIGI